MTYSLAQCLKQSLQIIILLTLTSEHAVAQDFNKGVTAYNSHDYAAALKELTPLANSNDPDAQAILKLMHRRGQGVAKDNKKSFAWYMRAAKQGHVEAQALVGGFFESGVGVLQDDGQAFEWFMLAAKRGHAEAQNRLASINAEKGTPKDEIPAYMWWSISAANGKTTSAKLRDMTADILKSNEIAQAKALARSWMNSNYANCGY